MLLITLRCVLGLSLLTAAARAQESDTWLSKQINGRALVRVSGQWGTRYLVKPRVADQWLTFSTMEPHDSTVTRLRVNSVYRIDVQGNSAGLGALVGAGIGLAGGVGLAAALCGSGECGPEAVVLVVGLGVAGSAGGALAGALVGLAFPRWRTVYRTAG